ncbi:aquaporin-4-like isoform X2 [Ranitomeya imitator]|uniref:aquaporin-4-like isoform X2 n=1 Tax=Ranitomeya imitator TaxID=111125 RepID=UPI0037E711B2
MKSHRGGAGGWTSPGFHECREAFLLLISAVFWNNTHFNKLQEYGFKKGPPLDNIPPEYSPGQFVFPPSKTSKAQLITNQKVSSEGNAGQALGMEIISTFQLAFTIFAVDDRRRRDITEPGSLAIGFSLTAGGLAAGHFSGGSMNPARSLGPALISGIWEHHWVYWIGPILGAFLAGASYEFFFASSASREKLVACLTCKDIEIVEAASVSRSSLSMATQTAARTRPTEQKHEQN